MSNEVKDIIDDMDETFKELKKYAPDYNEAFLKYSYESGKNGALSVKVKELIALALSIEAQCSFCIVGHTRNAAEAGATRQELIEAGMMAGLLGGGRVLSYLKYLFDTIKELNIK
jgi:AhpD family alkylhydroperoxidase